MDSLDKYLFEGIEHDEAEFDMLDEADSLIDETYEYMGVNKVYTIESNSASNIILKNGRTTKETISNSK